MSTERTVNGTPDPKRRHSGVHRLVNLVLERHDAVALGFGVATVFGWVLRHLVIWAFISPLKFGLNHTTNHHDVT